MREDIMTRVSYRASEASLSNESASDSRDGVSLLGVFNDPDPARGHEPDPTSIAFQPLSETSIHAASAVLLHQTAGPHAASWWKYDCITAGASRSSMSLSTERPLGAVERSG